VSFLEAMVLAFGAFTATCAATFGYGRWRVRRRLRIRPSTRSRVPTSWLVSSSGAARLHRRLRQAAALARAASARDPALAPLAAEIEEQALALEPHVLAAARAGKAGSAARRSLSEQISGLEQIAHRLAGSARAELLPGVPDPLVELGHRLDALEAARRELDTIEAQAGLRVEGRER
jgi:hypothetical protein